MNPYTGFKKKNNNNQVLVKLQIPVESFTFRKTVALFIQNTILYHLPKLFLQGHYQKDLLEISVSPIMAQST